MGGREAGGLGDVTVSPDEARAMWCCILMLNISVILLSLAVIFR